MRPFARVHRVILFPGVVKTEAGIPAASRRPRLPVRTVSNLTDCLGATAVAWRYAQDCARPRCDRIGRYPRRSVLHELSRPVQGALAPPKRDCPVVAVRRLPVRLGNMRRRRRSFARPTDAEQIRLATSYELTARLERVKSMIGDLTKVDGIASPAATALTDHIIQEIEVVRRTLAGQTGTN